MPYSITILQVWSHKSSIQYSNFTDWISLWTKDLLMSPSNWLLLATTRGNDSNNFPGNQLAEFRTARHFMIYMTDWHGCTFCSLIIGGARLMHDPFRKILGVGLPRIDTPVWSDDCSDWLSAYRPRHTWDICKIYHLCALPFAAFDNPND